MEAKATTAAPTAASAIDDAGPPRASGERPATWLRRWLALCGLVLVAATRRLWTPQDAFPTVPLIDAMRHVPRWLDWPLAALLALGLCGALVARPHSRAGRASLGLYVAATAVLVLMNQHRLQPWAWQFVLIATVLAASSGGRRIRLARWVVAGVYLHSGLSKLDRSFIETHGTLFVREIGRLLGLSAADWPDDVSRALALALPLGELAVAALLILWPRRSGWVWLSLPMHALLLLVLGPWGLDHEAGVLIWNVYFIGQNLILSTRFADARRADAVPAGDPASDSTTDAKGIVRRALSAAVLGLALGLPFLEPWGRWDVWPSWAVYASAPEQVWFEIRSDAAARLPEPLRKYVTPPVDAAGGDTDSWRRFRADHWSLDAVAAPIYPQSRFQTAVGLALARRYGLDDGIRAVALGRADRMSGQRWREVIRGRAAIERWASRYTLNVDAAGRFGRLAASEGR